MPIDIVAEVPLAGLSLTPQHERRTAAHAGTIVTVPATTMDALLEEHFPGRRLDVAVIDVEGGEIELLRGFTLAKWKPRLLLIEDNARLDDTPLARVMAAEPYVQIGWLNVNRVYVHRDEPIARVPASRSQ